MVQFNKFHIGEVVHNHEINEDGKIVGFCDTTGIPEYEVMVPVDPRNRELGLSLTIWSEPALDASTLSAQ